MNSNLWNKRFCNSHVLNKYVMFPILEGYCDDLSYLFLASHLISQTSEQFTFYYIFLIPNYSTKQTAMKLIGKNTMLKISRIGSSSCPWKNVNCSSLKTLQFYVLTHLRYVLHFPPFLNLMSRVKHLHPLSFTSFGIHKSPVLQFFIQHFRTSNRLLISHCNRTAALYAAVSAASVSMLSSWIIVRRNTIAIPHNTVLILERLLEKKTQMSRDMRFPTMLYVRPAKAQTSLSIRAD